MHASSRSWILTQISHSIKAKIDTVRAKVVIRQEFTAETRVLFRKSLESQDLRA